MSTEAKSCKIKEIRAIDLDRYESVSKILSALSNKTRIAIIEAAMNYGEVCACEMQHALGLPQTTITTHLRKMYDIGLLKQREVWKYSYYSVNPEYERLVSDLLDCNANVILPSDIPRSKNKAKRR